MLALCKPSFYLETVFEALYSEHVNYWLLMIIQRGATASKTRPDLRQRGSF